MEEDDVKVVTKNGEVRNPMCSTPELHKGTKTAKGQAPTSPTPRQKLLCDRSVLVWRMKILANLVGQKLLCDGSVLAGGAFNISKVL